MAISFAGYWRLRMPMASTTVRNTRYTHLFIVQLYLFCCVITFLIVSSMSVQSSCHFSSSSLSGV
eukprot:CAMPEP_0172030926 /NCGR_PEP_ID=MMETSP1041-20130122/19010_1 /TAXON_ID=464988 /ORGANISM="Hemiselmis andersenii, Strain CCMP439" /LENGTH=64 /DNA_ID=CAMNT_0012687359 /DNA_START=216 /DNA_END=410 /DNA_ORIENTATION=+